MALTGGMLDQAGDIPPPLPCIGSRQAAATAPYPHLDPGSGNARGRNPACHSPTLRILFPLCPFGPLPFQPQGRGGSNEQIEHDKEK
jgi:hypothetical protein